jgi:hypothetical protein
MMTDNNSTESRTVVRGARLRWLWLALFWVIFTAVLLEGGLRLIGSSLPGQLGVTARMIMTGEPYAEDWTPAWQQNRDHYYALRPNIQNALQYGTPTVSFHLTTNKLWDDGLPADEGIGFRNPPVDYGVDAVVVGDSFGFCFTELEDCWVNVFASASNLGVVNLSQPVTGSESHLKMLQDFGAAFEPPLVIWQFFGNDFNDDYGLKVFRGDIEPILDDIDTQLQPETSNGIVDWLSRNSVAFGVLETALTGQWSGSPQDQEIFRPQYGVDYGNGQTMQFGKLYERTALDMSRPANQYGLERSKEAFEQAKTVVEGWGSKLVIVIIPTREEVYDTLTEPIMGKAELDKQRSARLAMLDLCDELELQCLDVLPEFQELAQDDATLYYADDMHLNPTGNEALANILTQWLEAEPE